MRNDDDEADRDLHDHSDKDDDDHDDDAEQVLIGSDDPVCKSCGNFGHRSHRDHKCPNHHCAHCHKQGHTKRFCPDVQCPHCDLFGHVNKKDCKYKHCINVEVDWLNISIVINRLQFPLRLAYAMTFNKSQGQTLEKVLIDGTAQHLPGRGSINGAFMHGHCNVALSRVRNRESLAILVDETNLVTDPTTGKRAARTTNIVCRKILDM